MKILAITYNQFKESTQKREFDDHKQYLRLQKELREFYDEGKDFLFFYPRNLFNKKETEFIIFLKDGFVIVNKVENGYRYEQFYCKLVSKALVRSKFNNLDHQLNLTFDNGKELIFNSLEDSNHDWIDDYSISIKELYKIISR
ncbi:hypothetical protein [Bacillus cereus]|uniref:hypothetical protein n=1 Tax=Bacillus cereus TaxID=1396 RepID=UPI00211D30B8|nr:hypothetical protein [Bacillus cereus]